MTSNFLTCARDGICAIVKESATAFVRCGQFRSERCAGAGLAYPARLALYAFITKATVMNEQTTPGPFEPVDLELDLFIPHPDQDRIFAKPSPQEIERLADDMQRNGQRHPVHILPDGTIICGHSRVLAARHAGLTTLQAIVREDLAEQGESAVLRALAEDNLNRRHLSPLEIAKSFTLIHSADLKDAKGRSLARRMSALQKRLAEQFGLSKKTLQRYIKLLDSPLVIQHAVSKNQMSMDLAFQIQKQSKELRQRVVDVIKTVLNEQAELGERLPAKLKSEVLKVLDGAHQQRQAYSPAARLLKALRSALAASGDGDDLNQAHNAWLAKQRSVLVRGQKLIGKLIDTIDEQTGTESKAA